MGKRNSLGLFPLLREAFGGGSSLVWVKVGPDSLDLSVRPRGEVRHPLLNATTAAGQATALPKEEEHDAVPEIEHLLLLVPVVLPAAKPVFDKAPDRLRALEGLVSGGHVKHSDRVGGKYAHHRVNVSATQGLVHLPPKAHLVGGRELLGHPGQYPGRTRLRREQHGSRSSEHAGQLGKDRRVGV
jgi:hypothetical protein